MTDQNEMNMNTEPEQNPFNPIPPEKEPKKSGVVEMTTKKVVAIALCCSLVGGCVGVGGAALIGKTGKGRTTMQEGSHPTANIDITQIDTSKELTAAEIYAANVNSTVGITTQVTTNYFGFQTTSAASGSGFVLTADGYILTNYHVIENSSAIKVTLYDNTAYDATVVGFDESNDIAVLKIDAKDLTPVVLGDSDTLNVGDTVMAIGNPLGELTFSLTKGVVSALNREVTFSSGLTMDLIQTDCAINSGNSGGALFNVYGEVVGITNAKYGSSSSSGASVDNIGFAIPMNTVKSLVESIIEKGYVEKPYIGISVMDVGEESQAYGLPQGAAVKEVTEDGPADKAGLQANDIITAVNGTEIDGKDALVSQVQKCSAGDSLKLTVYRQGETIEVTVKVEVKKQTADQVQQSSSQSQQEQQMPGNPFEYFFNH